MTATVHLTDEEFNDLRELTHIDSADGAVRTALDEYRRYARRIQLKEMSGKVAMEDNWRLMEEAETNAPGPR